MSLIRSLCTRSMLRPFAVVRPFSSHAKVQELVKRELTPTQITKHVMQIPLMQRSVTFLWDFHDDQNMGNLKDAFLKGAQDREFAYFSESATSENIGSVAKKTSSLYPLEDNFATLLANYTIGFVSSTFGAPEHLYHARDQFFSDLKISEIIRKIWNKHKVKSFADYPQDIVEIDRFSNLNIQEVLENSILLRSYLNREPWLHFFKLASQDLVTDLPFPPYIKTIVKNMLEQPNTESAYHNFSEEFIVNYRSQLAARIFKKTLPTIPKDLAVTMTYGLDHRESFLKELIAPNDSQSTT